MLWLLFSSLFLATLDSGESFDGAELHLCICHSGMYLGMIGAISTVITLRHTHILTHTLTHGHTHRHIHTSKITVLIRGIITLHLNLRMVTKSDPCHNLDFHFLNISCIFLYFLVCKSCLTASYVCT